MICATMVMTMVACGNDTAGESSMENITNDSSTQSQVVEPEEKPVVGGGVQIPNPIVTYDTMEEVSEVVGFTFVAPTVPEGYVNQGYSVINSTLAQVVYTDGENEITFRGAKEQGDNSGDYNEYEVIRILTIGEVEVATKGTPEKIHVATWEKESISYSVVASGDGLSEEELTILIQSVSY